MCIRDRGIIDHDKKLAYPYFIWMVLFTVVPLIIVVYYAFTEANGAFTLDNLTSISGYGSVFARSLLLALIAIFKLRQRINIGRISPFIPIQQTP